MAPPAQTTGAAMEAMPGMDMAPPGVSVWTAAYLVGAGTMWAIMMVAMMLPSAAPMILLHDVFARRNGLGSAATLVFAAAYLGLWIAFAVLAALAQAALVNGGAVAGLSLVLGDRRLSAGLLLVAGLYELSPLKRACLSSCQSPIAFLTRYWRPGVRGAAIMGVRHGAYCIGCCWLLMVLLFVGGVMNLAWIAALTLIVLVERLAPPAWRADRILGVLLVAAAAVFAWPALLQSIFKFA